MRDELASGSGRYLPLPPGTSPPTFDDFNVLLLTLFVLFDWFGNQRKDVVAALHAEEHVSGWTECNNAVGASLRNHNSPASIGLLPGLLEQIEVMLFSGEQDLICAHTGTERLIKRLEWEGRSGFGVSTLPPPTVFPSSEADLGNVSLT